MVENTFAILDAKKLGGPRPRLVRRHSSTSHSGHYPGSRHKKPTLGRRGIRDATPRKEPHSATSAASQRGSPLRDSDNSAAGHSSRESGIIAGRTIVTPCAKGAPRAIVTWIGVTVDGSGIAIRGGSIAVSSVG